jgi:cobalt/nickel transport system permease protein
MSEDVAVSLPARPAELRERRPELYVLAAVGALLAAVFTSQPQVLVALGAAPLVQLVRARAPRARLVRRLASLAPIAVPAAVVRVAWARGATPFEILGLTTAVEALLAGAVIALRIAAAVLWSSWLAETLSAAQTERALKRLGLPDALVELLALTRSFATQLRATLRAAWTAAALRGGLRSPRTFAATAGLLAGVVLVRALDRSERVALALALRGGPGGSVRAHPAGRRS